MKTLLLLAFYVSIAPLALALDLSSISSGFTRDKADKIQDKDFSYTVMTDLSVRRIWESPQRRVTLDFDFRSGKLIMADVFYNKGVPFSIAQKDARALAQTEAIKWTRTKEDRVETIGLGVARMMKLSDGGFIFMEAKTAKKMQRVVLFAKKPDSDRFSLGKASTVEMTAMGKNANASAALVVFRDEENRYKRELAASGDKPAKKDRAVASVSDKPRASSRPAADSARAIVRTNPSTEAAGSTAVVCKIVKPGYIAPELQMADSSKVGFAGISIRNWCFIGMGLLVLFVTLACTCGGGKSTVGRKKIYRNPTRTHRRR